MKYQRIISMYELYCLYVSFYQIYLNIQIKNQYSTCKMLHIKTKMDDKCSSLSNVKNAMRHTSFTALKPMIYSAVMQVKDHNQQKFRYKYYSYKKYTYIDTKWKIIKLQFADGLGVLKDAWTEFGEGWFGGWGLRKNWQIIISQGIFFFKQNYHKNY